MKTSKIILLFLLAAGMTVLTACSTCAEVQKEKSCAVKAPAKRLKVGYYIDGGSQGGGVLHIARILYYSPQLEVTLIDGKDLRDGKLAGLDLFVIPGGSSERQYIKMGEAGAEAVRKFVREGGAFYGICAGFHCSINKPTRLRLMPYEHIPGGYGNVADLSIDISEEGAKLLNVSPGRHVVRYSQGPIVRRGKSVGETFAKTLAVYKGNITPLTRRGVDMYDTPAIIYGKYGKGKVIATSFHPESYSTTRPIWQGCVYAVTGVKPVPVYPAKNLRPVRVAFFAAAVSGKNYLREMFELDRHPDIDVQFISAGNFKAGVLDHADVLVLPDGSAKRYKDLLAPHKALLKDFMEQGKPVLASEKSFKHLPSHKNLKLIKLGSSYVNEVLKVK